MTKTQQLDELFENWYKYSPKKNSKMKRDGIICEETYNKQKTKILFIAKEPNDIDQHDGDFRDWWKKEVKYTFSIRISELAFGLLNNFPNMIKLPKNSVEHIEVMKSIAFMNLKKIGGGGSANFKGIVQAIEENKESLRREVEIINPGIVIGCGISDYWKYLYPDLKFEISDYDVGVAKYNDMRIINYYHPSYRVPRAMLYGLLGLIVNSEQFIHLKER